MSENAEVQEKEVPKRVTSPKTVEDLHNLTELTSTKAAKSYAAFMNKHLGHIEGFHMTDEMAWTVIYGHRVWQQSDERKAEKEQEKLEAAAEKEQRAKEREEKKAERERIAAEKKAEKERKAAEKAAKEAAEAETADDLDGADSGQDEVPTRRRRRKPSVKEAEATEAETVDA